MTGISWWGISASARIIIILNYAFLGKNITCLLVVFSEIADFLQNTNTTNLNISLLVKDFIDGQDYNNRLRNFKLEFDQIDYHKYFEHTLNEITTHISSQSAIDELIEGRSLKFLKAEWCSVRDTFINYFPFNTMKELHLQSQLKNKESRLWKKLMKYPTNHRKFPKRYQQILNFEKDIDELVAKKSNENIRIFQTKLLAIESKYKSSGTLHDGKQLDLIKMKFSDFLNIKFEKRTCQEKGVDPTIAPQMIASKLITTEKHKFTDEYDVIPDYNSDIIALISSNMDFVEAFKILHTLKVPCYMIHITNKLSKNLNGNQPYCTHLVITEATMKQFKL